MLARFLNFSAQFLQQTGTNIQETVAKYFITNFANQFIEGEQVSLETLGYEWSTSSGVFTLRNIRLRADVLNERLELANAPVRVVQAHIQSIAVSVQLQSATQSCDVRVEGVRLLVKPQPSKDSAAAGGQRLTESTLLESLSASIMAESQTIAEEILDKTGGGAEDKTGGLGTVSDGINKILKGLSVTVHDLAVRLDMTVGRGSSSPCALQLHAGCLKFKDNAAETAADTSSDETSPLSDIRMEMSDLSLYLDSGGNGETFFLSPELSKKGEPPESSIEDEDESEELYYSVHEHPCDDPALGNAHLEPIAKLTGESLFKLVSGGQSSNQWEVNGFIGGINVLLSPSQISLMLDSALSFGEGSTNPTATPDFREVPLDDIRTNSKLDNRKNLKTAKWSDHQVSQGDWYKSKEAWDVSVQSSDQNYFEDEPFHSAKSDAASFKSVFSSIGLDDYGDTSTPPPREKQQQPHHSASAAARRPPPSAVVFQQPSSSEPRVSPPTKMLPAWSNPVPGEDVVVYKMQLAHISLVLLEQDPPLVASDPARSTLAVEYFNNLAANAPSGLASKSWTDINQIISAGCCQNYLRLLVNPVDGELVRSASSASQCTQMHMSSSSVDLVECIFSSNHLDRHHPGFAVNCKPRVTSVLSLTALEKGNRKTCFDVTAVTKDISHSHSYQAVSPTKTAEVKLGVVNAQLDLTLAARLRNITGAVTSVLDGHAQRRMDSYDCQVGMAMPHTASVNEQVFNHAMDTSVFPTYSLNVQCCKLNASVRFPIADLRPPRERAPWWTPSLRPEVMLLQFDDIRASLEHDGRTTDYMSCDVYFQEVKGFWKDSANSSEKIHFLTASRKAKASAEQLEEPLIPDSPQITIKSRSFASNLIIDKKPEASVPSNDLDRFLQLDVDNSPSPFAAEKMIHIMTTMAGFDGCEGATESVQRSPGSDKEMKEFHHSADINSKLVVDISLPILKLTFPHKSLLELIYNRIVNDLLMYEAPPLETFMATRYGMNEETWRFAETFHFQSGSLDESIDRFQSSHTEEKAPLFSPRDQDDDEPNAMALILKVGKGCLTIFVDSEVSVRHDVRTPTEEEVAGSDKLIPGLADCSMPLLDYGITENSTEFLLDFNLGHICVVTGVKGEDSVLMSLLAKELMLLQGKLSPQQPPVISLALTGFQYPNYLLPVITSDDCGIQDKSHFEESNTNALAVAISLQKKADSCLKEFTAAINFCCVMLHHRMIPEDEQSWLGQIADYVSMVDQEIPGYVCPQVVTSIHLNFERSAILYRPVHMPMSVVLTVHSLIITCNIVTGSNATVISLLGDDVCLHLSNNCHDESINIHDNFACVGSMQCAELTVRKQEQKSSSEQPELSERKSEHAYTPDSGDGNTDDELQRVSTTVLILGGSRLIISTCRDSLAAVNHLASYVAAEGDLLDVASVDRKGLGIPTCQRIPLAPPARLDMDLSDDKAIQEAIAEAMADAAVSAHRHPRPAAATVAPSYHSPAQRATQSRSSAANVDRSRQRALDDSDSDEDIADSLLRSTANNDSVVSADVDADGVTEPVRLGVGDSGDDSDTAALMSDAMDDWDIVPTMPDRRMQVILSGNKNSPTGMESSYRSGKHGYSDTMKVDPLASRSEDPVFTFITRRFSMEWHMYAGHDFLPVNDRKKAKLTGHGSKPKLGKTASSASAVCGRDNRNRMSVLARKINVQYEVFPEHCEDAKRLVLLVGEIEVKNLLETSQINKSLYRYYSDSMPELNRGMVEFKVNITRCDPKESLVAEEASVFLRVEPIRLNIDQPAIEFLSEYFESLSDEKGASPAGSPATSKHSTPDSHSEGSSSSLDRSPASSLLPTSAMAAQAVQVACRRTSSDAPSRRRSSTSSVDSQPLFIKSFILAPDIVVVVDYNGGSLNMGKGPVIGLLYSLAKFQNVVLTLREIQIKHGITGWDRLVQHCIDTWIQDIKKYQVSTILSGVGPMHTLSQLFQGISDLFMLPLQQYHRDGRVVHGLQRGAASFGMLTTVSLLQLSSQGILMLQAGMETLYDLFTPSAVQAAQSAPHTSSRFRPHRDARQPADMREGMIRGAGTLSQGVSQAAMNLVQAATTEHRARGISGAVGGVLRQLPSSVMEPLVAGSEATVNLLDGVRNQLDPDSKRQTANKWRQEAT